MRRQVERLFSSDGHLDPFKEGVDIALRIGDGHAWPHTVEHRLLTREWHVFCASPAYLARHGTPLSDRDLEQHQCIAYGFADGHECAIG
ncbi:LysR substrate-binding domain-containing protein [Pseudomonas sp. HT11]|uniref:LysR substrate-binding domain-containing protein n=1 Tax=Pseudomonas sp. HT11 TaxID=3230490 RepID=UPI00384C5F43